MSEQAILKKMNERITEDARSNKNLKTVGEKYFFSIFSKFIGAQEIEKIPEGKSSSPDFRLRINSKEFLTEIKDLEDIYGEDVVSIFSEICREIGRTDISESFILWAEPCNIHRKYIGTFREKLREILKSVNTDSKTEFNIDVPYDGKTCKVKLEKKDAPHPCAIAGGTLRNECSNLVNRLRVDDNYKSAAQYRQIDFLTLINFNREIGEGDLLRKLFGGTSISFGHVAVNLGFRDDSFFHKYDNIKFVLVLCPAINEVPPIDKAYIVLAPYATEKFGSLELSGLMGNLRQSGFKVKVSSLDLKWVNFD
jgi:hypothetical protein